MCVYCPYVPGILQTNMYSHLVHCKSCCRTYDGNAQCCFEMDHVMAESFADHLEEIQGFVKSNPELLRRLKAMQKLYDDEVLTNEEVGNDLNQALARCELKEDTTGQLVSTINRLTKEKEEVWNDLDKVLVDLDEAGKQEEINGDSIRLLVSTISRLQTENEELKKKVDSTVSAEEYYANILK